MAEVRIYHPVIIPKCYVGLSDARAVEKADEIHAEYPQIKVEAHLY